MTTILQAAAVDSLEVLQEKFGLQQASSPVFPEWSEQLPSLSETERQALRRVKQNFEYLALDTPFSEEAVKMVVLSPLLDLAGFYQPPFKIKTEEPIEISAMDEDILLKGRIDVLVVQQQFWVLAIESKRTLFSTFGALPQALAYLLGAPASKETVYGLVMNGHTFMFLKLNRAGSPVYARSYTLDIEKEADLIQVLGALKNIKQAVLEGV